MDDACRVVRRAGIDGEEGIEVHKPAGRVPWQLVWVFEPQGDCTWLGQAEVKT